MHALLIHARLESVSTLPNNALVLLFAAPWFVFLSLSLLFFSFLFFVMFINCYYYYYSNAIQQQEFVKLIQWHVCQRMLAMLANVCPALASVLLLPRLVPLPILASPKYVSSLSPFLSPSFSLSFFLMLFVNLFLGLQQWKLCCRYSRFMFFRKQGKSPLLSFCNKHIITCHSVSIALVLIIMVLPSAASLPSLALKIPAIPRYYYFYFLLSFYLFNYYLGLQHKNWTMWFVTRRIMRW